MLDLLFHGEKVSRLHLKDEISDSNVRDESGVQNPHLVVILVVAKKVLDDRMEPLFL